MNGSSMITAIMANIVWVFAICLPMSFGDRDWIAVRICGKIAIRIISTTARIRLNTRFRMAERFPFRFTVKDAIRFGVTEPMAAPITRYTAV